MKKFTQEDLGLGGKELKVIFSKKENQFFIMMDSIINMLETCRDNCDKYIEEMMKEHENNIRSRNKDIAAANKEDLDYLNNIFNAQGIKNYCNWMISMFKSANIRLIDINEEIQTR